MKIKEQIEKIFSDSIQVKKETLASNLKKIEQSVKVITRSFKAGGKLLLFGNGGSAADSQHIAAEFIGRFQKERRSLPAIALTTDTSILTSLGNDYSYDVIFARQVEGLATKKDVVMGISTSGKSENVIQGIKKAKEIGAKTITLTGNKGGSLGKLADIHLNVPSSSTARIQESHICMAHAICELVEKEFSGTI